MKPLVALAAGLLSASVAVDLPPLGPAYTPGLQSSRGLCEPPESLAQAHDALGRLLPVDIVRQFARGTEDDARRDGLQLGLFVREFWGLWRGGALRAHLVKLGLRHPDDMSEVVLVTWWRVLNDRQPEVEAEVVRVKSAERWRPDPQCACLLRGSCTYQNFIRQSPVGVRAFVISGCCCAQVPQVAEGRLSRTEEFTFVFPHAFTVPEMNRACQGTSFAEVVSSRIGGARR